MDKWRAVKLYDLGEVNRGRSRHRPRDAAHLYGGPYPFIQTGDIKSSGGIITSHSQTYSEAGLKQSRLWPAGTMVITIAANIAETAILTYPACFPDSVIGFIADNKKCNVRFIEYMFRLLKKKIQHENVGTGSVQDNINLQTLDRLHLLVPTISEQHAISAILGSLDDKIDLNRRMNETLEAMARAIFKDWFVDFGPVRAKAEGHPPYLAPDLWALFPDSLDDDDKPVGWKLNQIEDIAEQCKGSISPSSEPERLFEHYSLPAFDSGQEPASDLGETIKSNKTLVPKGTVLLSKLNPEISRVWIPNDPQEAPQIASTEFLVFMPKDPVGRGLLYCLFRDSRFKQMLEGMVTGTSKSHQRISPPALLRSSGLCGSLLVFELFEKTISPILLRLLSNRAESQTLTQLRDLLLQKLMSGEIRLRDAEKMIEVMA